MDDPVSLILLIPLLATSNGLVILLGITGMLLLSAFFSGMEIAFISANKLRIELNSKQGSKPARLVSKHFKNPSLFISTTLVGNNIALVIYGILMGEFLEGKLWNLIPEDFVRFILVTIISTLVVLITAEFLPKTLFRINPNSVLIILIYPFQLFYYLFAGIVWLIHKITKVILKLFSNENMEDSPIFSKLDLNHIVNEYESTDGEEDTDLDTEIFKNAMDFSEIIIRECMIPRTEITGISVEETPEKALEIIIETGYSKLLIYEENLDNIIGYIHRSDFFKDPKTLKEITRDIIISNETMLANDLLSEFISKHMSMALVVDEYGGTAGIVTMEDIIEEIFGEIEDEHDTEGLKEVFVSQGEYIFSARLEVDYLNDTYNLNIPEGEYETLGGYIISVHEDIPNLNTVIQSHDLQFIITKVENSKILEVQGKRTN
jgi:CBS domain containing-hemolysin-like protein